MKMFLKITVNFNNGFSKNLYSFPVFCKVFSKNRIKMFLKIIINFYDDFFEKAYQNIVGFSYY